MATDIAAQILEALEAEAAKHAADIVDVELGGSDGRPIVRVRVDHADESALPITLDELAAHNAWIEPLIEEIDPVAGAYSLEVSSPGLNRPLRRARDFERFAGEQVSLTTTATDGRRRFTGELIGMVEGCVQLSVDGEPHSFALDEIKSCKIKPDFDALAKPKKK